MVGVLIIAQAVLCTTPVWAAARQNSPGATNPVDINGASIGDLRTKLKITETDARQIVRGRPYRSKDELLRKKLISKATYEKIAKRIVPNR
jgi:DNA uptake protein ComE-like DNA-binding protein